MRKIRVREPRRTHAPPPVHSPAALDSNGTLRRVLREVRPDGPRILAVLVIDLLAVPLFLLAPIPVKIAIDSVLGGKAVPGYISAIVPDGWLGTSSRVLALAAALAVVVVLLEQLRWMASYIVLTVVGERITLRFRSRLFSHVQNLSFQHHDAIGSSDSIYRVQYDAPSLRYATVDGLVPFAVSLITLVLTFFVLLAMDLRLALIALVVSPPVFLFTHGYGLKMRPFYRDAKEYESDALHVVQEVLSALRVVKAFGREDSEHARFVDRSTTSARAKVRLALAEATFGLLVSTTTAIGTAAVLYVGVRSVQSGTLTLGELLVVMSYLAQLYAPLRSASEKAALMQSSLAGAERAFEILDTASDVPERQDAAALGRATGAIQFDGVSFGYTDDDRVLEGLNFFVPAGARVGIKGRTGVGKTTLINLLPRFFDPTGGRILLDGADIRDLRLKDLRRQFAIVPQDTILFSTSISENIAYSRPDASTDDIVDAARAANAHEFIDALPQGYQTLVGERGMRLSGGERQRIALARAFLKNAPILILDEPTSSLDVRTEEGIMLAMERLMAGRTTFMIAHRLSTLKDCDMILDVETAQIELVPSVLDGRASPPKRELASRRRHFQLDNHGIVHLGTRN